MPDEPETPEGEPSDEAEPSVNAAEPKSLKAARTRAKLRKEQTSDVVRRAFSTEPGRRERWEILQTAHTFEERFACGPNGFPQPEATWFEAGQQALGFRLYRSWMRLAPEGVALMMIENDPGLAVAGSPSSRKSRGAPSGG